MYYGYNPNELIPHIPTALEWAVAWMRFLLHDTQDPVLFEQEELLARLEADAYTVVATPYYRPHVSAAALVASDPDRALSESLLGASLTARDPRSVATSIRRHNAWMDDLIETLSGERPPSGRQLRAVF